MAKNLFEKTVDLLIMAPHKHMDYSGNNPHGKPLGNFINLPRIRGALPLIFAFTMAAEHIDKDGKKGLMLQTFLTGGLSLVIAQAHITSRKKDSPLKRLYFDTSPDGVRPPPDTKTIINLMTERRHAQTMIVTNSAACTILTLFIDPVVIAASCAPMLMEESFRYWRASQVLKGNWSVDTELPKKQEQKAQLPANLALQPT